MTLCGIWVKADNGRWFDDPEIGGADWRLYIDEFGDDELFIRAQKVNGAWKPVIDPAQLIAENGLPVVIKSGPFRSSHGVIGNGQKYVVNTTGRSFPRAVILHDGDGHVRPGKQGTRVGCSFQEAIDGSS